MAHSEETVDLVRLLATQLAGLRTTRRGGQLHLPSGVAAYCNSVACVPALSRPCSPRCKSVTEVLTLAAEWCGCTVDGFYPQPKTKKRKAAG
jgi:hypothetical protein